MGIFTVDMRSAAGIVPGEDSFESQNAIFVGRLDTSEHCVVQLAIIDNAAGVATSNATIRTLYMLGMATRAVIWKVDKPCYCSATSQYRCFQETRRYGY